MLKEALEHLESQAKRAASPQSVSASLRNATLVVINGETKRIEHEPQPRRHKVASLDSFATLLNGPGDGDGTARINASVWHFGDMVVAIFDDSDASFRDDRAEWKLNGSRKFSVLTSNAEQPRPHTAFVDFLVENFRDELEESHPGLLGVIRKLRFTNNSEGNSSVQHGRQSMGKSVEAAITGSEPLPETVILNVKRWADLEHVIAVECLLKLDPLEGKLAPKPLADELQEAENKAQAWLHEQISQEVECPVYYGSP